MATSLETLEEKVVPTEPSLSKSDQQTGNNVNKDGKRGRSIDDLIESGAGETLSALEYEKVLNKRVAFFSGAFFDKCPVLCVPSAGLRNLEGDPPVLDDFNSTLSYLKPLLSGDHLTSGIVILLDGRKPTQSAVVKQVLERISSSDFPLKCHALLLMKASQLSQLSNFSFYFSKQKTKLASAEIREKINIISVKDREELYELIPQDQLTEDFGGSLEYNHEQWFKNAVLYEKVQKLRSKILTKFPDIRDGLNEFQAPQSIKDAERLMQQHLKLKEFFVNLFAEVDLLIDELIESLSSQTSDKSSSQAVVPAVGALSAAEVLAYLNVTNEEVKEEQAEFEKFWSSHKQHLDHMMRVCHYKKSVEKVRMLMNGHIEDMTMGTLTTGENLEVSLELGEKHEIFVSTCKEKMDEHLKDIREESVELCNLPMADGSARQMLTQCIEGVKESATSLTDLYQKLMKLCQQKRDLYIVAVKFHMTVRQCDQWCASVKEFTEYPPSPDTTSSDKATELMEHSDSLMKQMSQKNLNTLKELSGCLPEKDVKKLVSKTTQKCKNNRTKLEEYRNKLLQIIALSYTPPTPPQPIAASLSLNPKQATQSTSLSSLTASSSPIPSPSTPHQSLAATVQGSIAHTPPSSTSLPLTSSNASSFDNGSTHSLSGSDKHDGTQIMTASSEYINDEECDPAVLRKREFVYKEIVATEKDYIADLKIILDSYYNEMDEEGRVPLRLRGKKDVVFSNLKEIYDFHNDIFLKQIEYYSDHPERIGVCFIHHKEQFKMYSVYCRNRPNSEALLVQSTECQSFFKEIQIRLAHQLPLNSYLIKPIQRITKYQLLLKDMVKYCSNTTQALTDLKTALDMMLTVLKNLNDSLHVVGLKGFPGALAEQGRLLVHDPFQVWEGAVNSRHRLSRNHERHVFLFEKVVIFSKKKEDTTNQQKKDNKSDAYFYKSHLHLSEVQLKELPDDGPLVFGLAKFGGNKLTRLQANSKDIKVMWVSEIRRLLNNQFGLLKDYVLQSGTLDRAAAERYSKKGSSRGRTKIFDDVSSHQPMESKKSFSERFKFNIKQKKKENDPRVQTQLYNKVSAPITSSLGGAHKLKVRDDNALVSSIPPQAKLKTRTKSHDNLMDEEEEDNGQKSVEDDEWSNDEMEDEDATSTSGGTTDHFEILAPGRPCFYTAIADYNPSNEDNGVPLSKGQEVELIGVNQYSGWWWVRSSNYYSNDAIEGWVPASFLQILEFN